MKKILAITFLIFVQSCNTANKKTGHDSENNLIGTWKYIADQLLDSANNVIREDTAVTGLLIYTPDGKVSVQFLWKGARAPMLNDTIMNNNGLSTGLGLGFNTWSTEQAKRLIDTYEAYFGDYLVDLNTNTVTHTLSGNLRPEKEGTVYKRVFQLRGDSLFLRSADPVERWGVACVRSK